MSDDDLPPELRQHHQSPAEALPLQIPLDDELTPPPDQPRPSEPREVDPYLRRS